MEATAEKVTSSEAADEDFPFPDAPGGQRRGCAFRMGGTHSSEMLVWPARHL